MVKTKSINLALQGGGAHGAFTWGVLDRLLEEERLDIAAISGTSAGAMNGAALKSGLLDAGRDGAKAKLNWLWSEIGAVEHPSLPTWMTGMTPAAVSHAVQFSPLYMAMDAMSRISSPYATGPLYSNPLTRIAEQFSYDRVCAKDGPNLYICATNVRSGKIRIFHDDDITADAIVASACLPTIFKAVEIFDPKSNEIEAYWDGGYMGNPALFPLFGQELPRDLVIVNINPLHREKVPTTPQEIQNRINEISFNGSLFRELRAIHFVRRLLSDGSLRPGSMKNVLVHMIADDALMTQLSVATKTIPTPYVLSELKAAGRNAADGFLRSHWGAIGKESTVDLREMFD
jgi:NTE family protein